MSFEAVLTELSAAAEAVRAYECGVPGSNLQSVYDFETARRRAREAIAGERPDG